MDLSEIERTIEEIYRLNKLIGDRLGSTYQVMSRHHYEWAISLIKERRGTRQVG
jgi:hypothetical protein